MSVESGPDIVTNGLVLELDGANVRSFRGEPTTNLSYNNGQTGSEYLAASIAWTNSGTWTLNTDNTSIVKPTIVDIPNLPTLPTNLRVISGVTDTVGSQHHGCAYTNISPSTTYTISVWFRQNRAGSSGPYLRTNVNNNQIGTFSYNGSTDTNTWPVNKWIRISATGTTQANENGIYLSNYIGSQVGDAVYYYGHQTEAKSYSTPLVAGTRGTTNATGGGWVDLSSSKTSGELVNGPTFNSANSGFLTFDGINDYVSNISNTGITHGTNNFSYFTWVRLQGKPSLGTIFENGSWTSCLLIRYETDGITIYSMSSYWGKFSFNPTLNTWNHLGFIRNGNVIEFYVNGVYQTNIAFTANISPSSNIFIGTSQHATGQVFNGDIAVAQIYTRALSVEEVVQNFNAQRDRFGI